MEFSLVKTSSKAKPIFLNDQQQVNKTSGFDAGTLMQHSGIGGFEKWNGVLTLYHGLITCKNGTVAALACVCFMAS